MDESLSVNARVAEVNVVPVLEVVLIRNRLPIVGVAVTVQVSVCVSSESENILSVVVTHRHEQVSVAQSFSILVFALRIDRQTENRVPNCLLGRSRPTEPTAD